MLLGNYTQLNANPGRNIGGFSNPYDWMKISNVNKFYLGEAVVSNQTDRSSFNNGYYHPYVWTLSPKAGGLSIYNGIKGSANISNANLAGGLLAESNITGSGSISSTIIGLGYLLSTLSGTSSISSDTIGQIQMAASLIGQGDLTGSLGALVSVLADLAGQGTVSGEGLAATFITSDLSGTSNVIAGITGAINIVANIVGNSSISTDIIGSWPMLSTINGSGALIGNINAAGILIAALLGSSTVALADGVNPALISADISAIGEVLTSESVASAVWSALATNFNSVGTMGEKLNDSGGAANPWAEIIVPGADAGTIMAMLHAFIQGKDYVVDNLDGTKTYYSLACHTIENN